MPKGPVGALPRPAGSVVADWGAFQIQAGGWLHYDRSAAGRVGSAHNMCVCYVQATRTRTKKTFLDAAMGLAACFLVRAHLLTDSSPGRFVYLVVLLPRVLSLLLASCGAALTNIPLPQGTPFLLELHVCSRGRVFGPHARPRGVAPFREVFPASQSLQQLGSRRLCGRHSRWGPGRSPGPGGAVRQNEDRCALRWFDFCLAPLASPP